MNKQVWRMNSGAGVPSDAKRFGEVVFYGGEHDKLDSEPEEYYWHIDECEPDIIAYETNRTREAKYERVECDVCFGRGDLELHSVLNTSADVCRKCNGKGYRLEMVE